jgi:hypothetical protein
VAKFDDDCKISMSKKDKIDMYIENYKRDHIKSFTTVTKPIAVQTLNLLEYFTKSKLLMAGYKITNVNASLFIILEELILKPEFENTENLKSNSNLVTKKDDVKTIVMKYMLLNDIKWYVFRVKI